MSIQPDLMTLFELIRQPVPKKIEVSDKTIDQLASTLATRNAHGYLNILVLQKDGLVKLTASPISSIYLPVSLFGQDGGFIGQHSDGVPNGFIQFIGIDRIFEGHVNQNGPYGWGRMITANQCMSGWWKGKYLQGNSRKYKDEKIESEGWFLNHIRQGDFDLSTRVYQFWEDKDQYCLKYNQYNQVLTNGE